jgi:hypothetical protein
MDSSRSIFGYFLWFDREYFGIFVLDCLEKRKIKISICYKNLEQKK